VTSLLAATGAEAQAPKAPVNAADQSLPQAIRSRLDAYARGDSATWGRYVADDCLCSSSSKAAIQQEITARPPGLKIWFGEIDGLEVRVNGDTAVARYRVTEYSDIGTQRIASPQWRVECYVRGEGGWLLIAGADSAMAVDPPVARVDPKVYEAYEGQYEYAPGMVDTVRREGGRLMVQPAGQGKEELFAQDEATYFAKGQEWRMIFVKDEYGRVTSVRFRFHEQDVVGRKIK
jgi:hypothetical protein